MINTRALEVDGQHVEDPVPGFKWYTDDWWSERDNDIHKALDIVARIPGKIEDAAVYSVMDGVVKFSYRSRGGGHTVIIDHQNGYMTIYMHLRERCVKKNQQVYRKRGNLEESTQIGIVGNSGKAHGFCLHYAVHTYNLDDPPKHTWEMDWRDAVYRKAWAYDYGNPEEEGYKHREPDEIGEEDEEDDSWDGDDGEEDGDPGTNPGGERPDDNESSSASNPSYYTSDSKARFYRLAPKKGKPNILLYWNFEKLLEERDQYFESLGSGGSSDETYLDNLNTRINEAYNLFSKNSLQYNKERSETPDVVILKHGYFGSASSLISLFKDAWKRVPPSFSPLWVKENPVMMIPTGGLYGMENSEIFKAVLEEYVRNGGTLIVFTQQHGYEFSVLPTPDGEPIVAYGWREDQSCTANSVYVDTWHPALSSTTKKLIGNPIDGYFAGYPSDSSVLLRRRVNGMPAMLSYPYGEGWVVVTSLFTDWIAFFQDKKIIRNLITWAKNPDLEIPEYNLRDNPNPEVVLNLEIKNISDETASKAKILWLDPERNLYFEEEILVSIPAGRITIPENCIFSEISIF